MESIHRIGIDVGKEWLDVSLPGTRAFRVSNTHSGIEELKRQLPKGVVYLESTGGFERLVCKILKGEGIEVRVVDPLRARRFCQSQSLKAKTDKLDAKALGQFGDKIPSRLPKTSEQMNLQDMARARESLRDTAAQYRKKASSPELAACVKQAYLRLAKAADTEAKAVQTLLMKELSKDENYKRVQTVPGVGPILALTLMCELPSDWRQTPVKQLVSYSGLAPMDRQSGNSKRTSRLGRGNSHLKGALHQPALSLLVCQPWARTLYDNLRSKGRNHQQAIVAVMRRLLVRAIAVLKRETPWRIQA